jgi:hypothetical protein
MTTPHKRATDEAPSELEFGATQEIDTGIVEALLMPPEPTLAPGDFDDTEVMLDLGLPKKPPRRR